MMKEVAEGSNDPLIGKLASLLLASRQIHAVDHTKVFPESEIQSDTPGFLLIGFCLFAHDRGLWEQNRWYDTLASTPSYGLLTDRKGLEQSRMRPLIRLGHHINLLNAAKLVDLARKTIFSCPLCRRPGSTLLRIGILIIFAFETERLITPGQLQKLEHLFERFPIDAIGFTFVAAGSGDVNLLRHLVEPPCLVASRKADEGAPLGQLIEPRDFEREAQWIPSGKNIANGANFDMPGVMNDVLR